MLVLLLLLLCSPSRTACHTSPPSPSYPTRPQQVMTEHNKPTGYDRVRGYEIGLKDYELTHLDEAFTSEHWIVRIFSVKKPANRAER